MPLIFAQNSRKKFQLEFDISITQKNDVMTLPHLLACKIMTS